MKIIPSRLNEVLNIVEECHTRVIKKDEYSTTMLVSNCDEEWVSIVVHPSKLIKKDKCNVASKDIK